MGQALYKKLEISQESFRKFLIEEYHNKGLSQAKIANILGCHTSSIECWFKKFKIERRTQSEALANRWKKQAHLSKKEKEQLTGWLLSDGTLDASKYSGRFTIGLKHKSVLELIQKTLPSLHFTPIWTSEKTKCSHMKSHSYLELKTMHDAWYCNGTKRLPQHLFLTPEILYYWFIGDGTRVSYGIQLSTESFTRDENEFLSKLLQEIRIENSVLKSNKIRVKSNSLNRFYKYIGQCKHKVYEYKWRNEK